MRWCFKDGWYTKSITTISDHPHYPRDSNLAKEFCMDQFGYFRFRLTEDTLDMIVYFRTEDDATMFKMTYGGEYNVYSGI